MFRQLRPFFVFATVLVLAALALEHINGRFWLNDFRVYYMAATNLREGLPIYGVVFGEDTGLYKYLPFPLYFFIPLTYLDFQTAATVHWLLMGAMLMACFAVMERAIVRAVGPVPKPALRAMLGLLCIAVLLVRELHLGNINLGLLFLVLFGVERHLSGKPWAAGISLGIAWLIKPYLLLMIVPLVVRRSWKTLGAAFAAMLAGLLLPMMQEGPAHWWEMLQEWGRAVARHNLTIESPDRLGAIITKLFHTAPSTTLDLALIALAGALLAAATWYGMRHELAGNVAADRAMELWTACAVVPNLVITDQQHFMFTLPLVLYILARLFERNDRLVLVLFLLALIPYATRSSDLWGSALEDAFTGHGVLGSGNLFLVSVAWVAHIRYLRVKP